MRNAALGHCGRRISCWMVAAVAFCVTALVAPNAATAQSFYADIWDGAWYGDFESDSGTAQLQLFGRAVADDSSGFEVMTLYGQLKPPSGSPYIDSGGDSGFMYAEVNLVGILDAWSMEGGDYKTAAQMWYGSAFNGCVDALFSIQPNAWYAERTGSCGAPGVKCN